jgi:hypothetical protein
MPPTRWPNRALFAASHPELHKARGGQALTWQRQIRSLTGALNRVGSVRLPGWGPRDSSHRWLVTLQDMAVLSQLARIVDLDCLIKCLVQGLDALPWLLVRTDVLVD